MKRTDLDSNVFLIEDFLTNKECEDLIIFSEQKGYEEATISTSSGPRMIKAIRNNERVIIQDTFLANKMWSKLSSFVTSFPGSRSAFGLNEQFRFYKYKKGQRFNKHRDGRYIRNKYEESRMTFMIYLNHNFEGGETEFEYFDVKPQVGMALIFRHEVKHRGAVVDKGEKYVLRSDVMFKKEIS